MDFRFTPEQQRFREEIREFLHEELTQEIRDETMCEVSGISGAASLGLGSLSRQFIRKLGAKGWIGISWPKKYGGQERPIMYEYILFEELNKAGAPQAGSARGIVGPTLLHYGSEEHKREFLPRIARGELEFTLGYTEPEAGTDLASMQTRAVRDGDDYVINGTKVFQSAAHYADYIWLAARTDPNVPKHRGLSLFIVPQKHPGITVAPMWTMAGGRTNVQYLENIRVPKTALVGEENRGWYYLAVALDLERLGIMSWSLYFPQFLQLVEYCKSTRVNGQPLSEEPAIRHKLSELYMAFEVGRLLTYRCAWMMDKSIIPNYETAMIKLYHTELQRRMAVAAMEITGHMGTLRQDSYRSHPMLRHRLEVERMYRYCHQPVFAAGTAAVMRTIISMRGFGLPRAY
ncbi:MAG: acyl-CoA dehydrogenase family protein [Chloroflexi bacterium]|nr:acyl-CoA dehydrogenase family protein [Chloroflexota bacterium]